VKTLLLSLAVIAGLAGPAVAAPRTHPEGFSLDIPADWRFSETSMTLGTRWVLSKIHPSDNNIGVILSAYVLTETEVEPMIKDLRDIHKIPDLTWAPAQKTTFDGMRGTKRNGKAKGYDFTAYTLETSMSKRVVFVAMQLGGDRQQRLELELILGSIKRVPMKTTSFPLSDGVWLDVPTTWSISKGAAPKPFNGLEWMYMSNATQKAPIAIIYMRTVDTDKLAAGLKVLEDEDTKEVGPITWGAPSTSSIGGVRATTRVGKQRGEDLTLTIVETSATTRSILWSVALGDAALEAQMKAVLASLRKR
jgi:hypothetical protein